MKVGQNEIELKPGGWFIIKGMTCAAWNPDDEQRTREWAQSHDRLPMPRVMWVRFGPR